MVEELQLWPEWETPEESSDAEAQDGGEDRLPQRTSVASILAPSINADMNYSSVKSGEAIRTKHWFVQRLIIRPSSRNRLFWDILSVFVVTYDVIMIPMQAFSYPPRVTGVIIWEYCITVFWTLDMVFSFFTGFNKDGAIEMRPTRIARRYFATWFVLDATVIMVDWIVLFVEDGDSSIGLVRVTKSFRAARVLRMLRLLRILKLLTVVSELTEYIQSEATIILLGVMKLLAGIFVLNHLIACTWYFVGTLPGVQDSWVLELQREHPLGARLPDFVAYRYATSLHWSLTQFTPASMEVTPKNVLERFFTICVIMIALVLFSSFVSSITAAMTQLRKLNEDNAKAEDMIRRYVTENKVSIDLGNRLYEFMRRNAKAQKQRLKEADVPTFGMMSEVLRVRLRYEVHMPRLEGHFFFHRLRDTDEVTAISVCHKAAREESVQAGNELFKFGENATRMWAVLSGQLDYYLGNQRMNAKTGNFLAEPVLWACWKHRGPVVASTWCDLVSVASQEFRRAVLKRAIRAQCKRYARLMVEKSRGCQPSDLGYGDEAVREIVGQAWAWDSKRRVRNPESNSGRLAPLSPTNAAKAFAGRFAA